MRESGSLYHIFSARLALPGKWEPDDQATYVLVYRGTPDAETELIRLFVERFKEALEIPILDEWAAPLWNQASDQNFVQNLTTGGDCILGARIDLQANWQELLTDLLKQELISLTG